MKEWTEVLRDQRYFNLLVTNTLELDQTVQFRVLSHTGPIEVHYEQVRIINHFGDMENPPTHIAVSEAQCHATPESTQDHIVPHASDPAPAQRAGSIAFMWCPEATKMTTVRPYRDDGFPAVVLAVGLSKHYDHGKLHRKRQHAAIKAEYLAAFWHTKSPGENERPNGPSSIAFENYKEFWVEGEYKGNRWTGKHPEWRHRILDGDPTIDYLGEFLSNLKGTTNDFTPSYFTNAEDEVCYMADFA